MLQQPKRDESAANVGTGRESNEGNGSEQEGGRYWQRRQPESTQRTTHQPDDSHGHGDHHEHWLRSDVEQAQTDHASE
jgi:hypothetical protein